MAYGIKVDLETLTDQIVSLQACSDTLSDAVAKSRKGIDSVCEEVGVNPFFKNLFLQATDKIIKEMNDQCTLFNKSLESLSNSDKKSKDLIDSLLNQEIYHGVRCVAVRSKIDSINPPRQRQTRHDKHNGADPEGMCTIDSMTTLLNRRYALEHVSEGSVPDYYSLQDVLETNGCTGIRSEGIHYGETHNGQEYFEYVGGTTGTWHKASYSNGSDSNYTAHAITRDEVARSVNENYGGSLDDYVVSLLNAHPEGICVRVDNKLHHAVVITGYDVDETGNISFYINDPIGDKVGYLKDDEFIYTADTWNCASLDNEYAFVYLE